MPTVRTLTEAEVAEINAKDAQRSKRRSSGKDIALESCSVGESLRKQLTSLKKSNRRSLEEITARLEELSGQVAQLQALDLASTERLHELQSELDQFRNESPDELMQRVVISSIIDDIPEESRDLFVSFIKRVFVALEDQEPGTYEMPFLTDGFRLVVKLLVNPKGRLGGVLLLQFTCPDTGTASLVISNIEDSTLDDPSSYGNRGDYPGNFL